jgi:hypothetical protein
VTLFCLIRRKKIIKTPEEEVRQRLLSSMLYQLGYPAGLVAVEKSLAAVTRLSANLPFSIPDRRIDIAVFSPDCALGLQPLLLIECKAFPWRSDVFLQLMGYNRFIGASWIAVACPDRVQAAHFAKSSSWNFREGLPSYEEAVSKNISPSRTTTE